MADRPYGRGGRNVPQCGVNLAVIVLRLMRTKTEPPPELAPHDVISTEEALLELPAPEVTPELRVVVMSKRISCPH